MEERNAEAAVVISNGDVDAEERFFQVQVEWEEEIGKGTS